MAESLIERKLPREIEGAEVVGRWNDEGVRLAADRSIEGERPIEGDVVPRVDGESKRRSNDGAGRGAIVCARGALLIEGRPREVVVCDGFTLNADARGAGVEVVRGVYGEMVARGAAGRDESG